MKNILIVIPYFELYPPMNGGMLRCFHILCQLARYFKVTAIIHQDKTAFLTAVNQFPELRDCEIISTKNSPEPKDVFYLLPGNIKNGLRFRYWKRNWKGPADNNFLLCYPILSKELKRKRYDYVVLENISSLNAVPVIRRLCNSAFIIYDAHNVDSRLAVAFTNGVTDNNSARIKEIESTLHQKVDGVIVCSKIDLDIFREMNTGSLKGVVVPNGIEIRPSLPGMANEYNQLIFCGSLDYEPNRQGLFWFCTEVIHRLIKRCPSVRLSVIGKGDPGIELSKVLKNPAISFHGRVETVDPYYQQAAVAVVPLFAGSGTRLKVLEAMSRHVPVVSTSKGAEGIDYTDVHDIFIADDADTFSERIIELIQDKGKAAAIAANGYLLVKQRYDWNVIGRNLAEAFRENFN